MPSVATLARIDRDEVLALVDEGTDPWWRSCADAGIEELAARGLPFQCADLIELGVPEPRHPNQWGSRLHAAARRGVVCCVGYAPSRRPTVRTSIVRVWRGVR